MNIIRCIVLMGIIMHTLITSMQFEFTQGYEERRQHNSPSMKPDQLKDDSFLHTIMYGFFEEKKKPFISHTLFLTYHSSDEPNIQSDSMLIWKTGPATSHDTYQDDHDVFLYYQDLGAEITKKNMVSSIEGQRFKMYVESTDLNIITDALCQNKHIKETELTMKSDLAHIPLKYRNQIAHELELILKCLYNYKKKLNTDEQVYDIAGKKTIIECNRKALHDAFIKQDMSAIVKASRNPRQIDLLVIKKSKKMWSNSDSNMKINIPTPLSGQPASKEQAKEKKSNPLLRIPLLRRVLGDDDDDNNNNNNWKKTNTSSTPRPFSSSEPEHSTEFDNSLHTSPPDQLQKKYLSDHRHTIDKTIE